MALNLKIYDNPQQKTKSFSAFDGIDLVSPFDTISDKHSPCMVNMYRDYFDGSVLRTRPAFKELTSHYSVTPGLAEVHINYAKVLHDTLYMRLGIQLMYVDDNGDKHNVIYNDSRAIFSDEKASRRQCVEYNNKIYFYENDDVYIFDGAIIEKFSDILTQYESIFSEGGNYTVITLPKKNDGTEDRYSLSDYTNADAIKARAFVSHQGTLTEPEENKYDINADGAVTLADVNKIYQIVEGEYKGEILKALSLDDLPIEIAPMVNINTDSNGSGTEYERFNLLSPYFIVQYVFDSTKSQYTLPIPTASAIGYQNELSGNYIPIDTPTVGSVTLSSAQNEDKIRVLCKLSDVDYLYNASIVRSMKIFEIFDNRVFAAGAEIVTGYQNRVMHSGIDNMLYFPDNAYYEDIMGSGKITALLPVKSQLAVIKEDIVGDNAIYMHTPKDTDNELAPRIYPSIYGMFDCGCINCHCYCQFGGESLFLSKSGLMAFTSSDVTNEKSIQPRTTALGIRNIGDAATIFATNEYLYVYFDDGTATQKHMFVAGARTMTRNVVSNNYEYEWFDWLRRSGEEENIFIFTDGLQRHGGMLIIGVSGTSTKRSIVYKPDKTSAQDYAYRPSVVIGGETTTYDQFYDIYSCIALPFCSFGYPQYNKDFVRHACAANVNTSVNNLSVYTHTDITGFAMPTLSSGEWRMPTQGYTSIGVITNGTQRTLRPSERNWRYASFVFFTPKGIMKFYDVTITAAIKNAVNNIY